jgi:hypothetical protein
VSIRETVADSVTDTIKNLEDWSLDAIKSSEGAVLSATKTVAETLEPVTDRLPTAAVVDGLPEPKKVVTNWFDYLGKVLAQQKRFSVELTSTLVPTHTVSRRRSSARSTSTRRKAA